MICADCKYGRFFYNKRDRQLGLTCAKDEFSTQPFQLHEIQIIGDSNSCPFKRFVWKETTCSWCHRGIREEENHIKTAEGIMHEQCSFYHDAELDKIK